MLRIKIDKVRRASPPFEGSSLQAVMQISSGDLHVQLNGATIIRETAPLWMIYTEIRALFSNTVIFGEERTLMLLEQPWVRVAFDLDRLDFKMSADDGSFTPDHITIREVQYNISLIRNVITREFAPHKTLLKQMYIKANDQLLYDVLSTINDPQFC